MAKLPELLGSIEFARAIGYERRKFSVYLSRNKFPEPAVKVGTRSFWTREQVNQYIEDKKIERMSKEIQATN